MEVPHMADSSEILRMIEQLKVQGPAASKAASEFLDNLDSSTDSGPFIEALTSNNSLVRKFAAEGLGKIQDQNSVEPLIQSLQDDSMSVRKFAAEALGKLGDSLAVHPLIDTLQDENIYVRKAVAEALGKLGDMDSVEPLMGALADENLYVRWAAVDALAKLKDDRAVESLITMLKDKESYVRWATVKALGELRDKQAIGPLKEALKDEDAMVRISAKSSINKLMALKKDIEPPARPSVKKPVAQKTTPLPHKPRGGKFKSKSPEVEEEGDEDKGKRKLFTSRRQEKEDTSSSEELMEVEGKKEPEAAPRTKPLLKKGTDKGLLKKGEDTEKPKLTRGSKSPVIPLPVKDSQKADSPPEVEEEVSPEDSQPMTSAQIARQALMKLREKKGGKSVGPVKDSPTESGGKKPKGLLQSNAFQAALKRLKERAEGSGTEKATATMPSKEAKPEDDPFGSPYEEETSPVSSAAGTMVEEDISEEEFDDIEKIFNILMEALSDEDPSERKTAVISLGELADTRSVDALIEALFNEKELPIKLHIEEALGKIGDNRAVEPLIEILQDENHEVRQMGAETLGKLGDPRAIDALAKALYDTEASVRGNAVLALDKLRANSAVPSLISLVKDESSSVRKTVVETLGNFGDKSAFDALVEALNDDDATVRASTTMSLAKLGDMRAMPHLQKAKSDPDFFVSMYAPTAIKKLEEIAGGGAPLQPSLPSLEDDLYGSSPAKPEEEFDAPYTEPPASHESYEEEIGTRLTEDIAQEEEPKRTAPLPRLQDYSHKEAKNVWEETSAIKPETMEQYTAEETLQDEPSINYGDESKFTAAIPPETPQDFISPAEELISPGKSDETDLQESFAEEDNYEATDEAAMDADLPYMGEEEPANFKRPYYTPPPDLIDDVKPIKELIMQLRHKDKKLRHDAAKQLGDAANRAAVKPLIKALGDADPQVRWRAAEALGKLRDPAAVSPIIKLLNDNKGFVREYAAEALGKMGDLRAVNSLMGRGLRDKDHQVRLKVAKALVQLGDPRAVDAIKEARKKEGIFSFKMKGEMANAIKELEANII